MQPFPKLHSDNPKVHHLLYLTTHASLFIFTWALWIWDWIWRRALISETGNIAVFPPKCSDIWYATYSDNKLVCSYCACLQLDKKPIRWREKICFAKGIWSLFGGYLAQGVDWGLLRLAGSGAHIKRFIQEVCDGYIASRLLSWYGTTVDVLNSIGNWTGVLRSKVHSEKPERNEPSYQDLWIR